jgi:tetratricopeptide (TPR) repeat protein
MSKATVDRVLQAVAADVCVDRSALATLLRDRPSTEQIVPLLSVPAIEVVRAAVVYLGLYGSVQDSPLLVLCLQHRDDEVARLAEHCLWSLWMQGGSREGNRQLAAAMSCIRDEAYAEARTILETLIAQEPGFAEAHFQQGVALSHLDRTHEAADAYREALRRNPYHFAASAALGHTLLELGEVTEARHHYRRALQIHPRLDDVRDTMRQVDELIDPSLDLE